MAEDLAKGVANMEIEKPVLPEATGMVALSGKKPKLANAPGTPVDVLTNLRKITVAGKHPIYKYSVCIVYVFEKKTGGEGSYEVSKSTRSAMEHDLDKSLCHRVYQKVIKNFFSANEPSFYDRQASLYTFNLIKDTSKTINVTGKDISSRKGFIRAEFSLKKVEESFQTTSDSILSGVNLCPKLIDRTLVEALNLIISAPIFADPQVFTTGGCVHYLYGDVPNMKTLYSNGRSSAAGVKKAVKILEGDSQDPKKPSLYMATELKTTFFHPDNYTLLQYLQKFKDFNSNATNTSQWAKANQSCFAGLYVVPTYGPDQNQDKVLKIRRFGPSPKVHKFRHEEKEVTIEQYFKTRYNLTLKYPHLFTVEAKGAQGKPQFIPVELLNVVNGQTVTTEQMTRMEQSQLIPLSGNFPHERKERTEFVTESVGLTAKTLHNFIEIGRSAVVKGLVLPKPDVFFSQNRKVDWNDPRKKFPTDFSATGGYYKAAELTNWEVVFNQGEKHDGAIGPLLSTMKMFGMNVKEPATSYIVDGDVETVFQKAKERKRQLLLFITQEQYHFHKEIKSCEQRYGIISQDLKYSTATKLDQSRDTRQNIVQKINTKLGGINYVIASQALTPNRLIIGFGTSQQGGSGDGVVAVGYSANFCGHYQAFAGGYVYVNRSKDIYGPILRATFKKIIHTLMKNRKDKPNEVVVYFNGVTEGQYALIREVYLAELQKGCVEIRPDFKPAITLIASSKTHTERFYKNVPQKVLNLEPGTVIFTDVVSPVLDEFYLTSAVARKGTVKTTKYTMVYTSSTSPLYLYMRLTFDLCFLHEIIFHPVGLPAPLANAEANSQRGSDLASWNRDSFENDVDLMNSELCVQDGIFGKRFNA